jgi:anti-sigma B factor antagonist
VIDKGNNPSLTIEIGTNRTIIVHGDIDMAGGPSLDAAIIGLETDGPIVIDLSDVSFIDSSGLRSLLSASRRAEQRHSSVTLRNVGAEVTRLFEITGTTELFTIEPK